MGLAFRNLSFSASEITTFEDCAARYYHGKQGYDTGLLPTDRTPADVASAVHDGLMDFQRQLEQNSRRGSVPTASARRELLQTMIDRQLRRKRLDRRSAGVAARLAKFDHGIDQAMDLIAEDLPKWAVDSETGDLLVWAEAPLNHGPEVPAVELESGFLVRTRPDVIGLHDDGSGTYRAVVRDFKAKNNVAVDPAFDVGILVRGFWALMEMRQPRCRWFLAGRHVRIDDSGVDLETVNLAFAGTDDFLVQARLTVDQLSEVRVRVSGLMSEMAEIMAASPAEVPASPGGLCLQWCPYLGYCEAGRAHVRKYHGEDQIRARLRAA